MNAKIGDWQRIADLGEGSFGVVSLWANRATKEEIGKISSSKKFRSCDSVFYSHKALQKKRTHGKTDREMVQRNRNAAKY